MVMITQTCAQRNNGTWRIAFDDYDDDDDESGDNGDNDDDDQTNLCLEEQWHKEDCYIASPGRHCPGIAEPNPPDYEHHENQTINDLLDK